MKEVGVVVVDPSLQSFEELIVAIPFLKPDEIFFHGSEHAFGIGIALGVIEGGEDLFKPQHPASSHEVG